MLKNSIIFILSNAKYDGPFESTSFISAKHLAKNNKVFYIEYPATYKDYLKHKNEPEFIKRRDLYNRKSDGLLATEIGNLQILIIPLLLSINFLPEGFFYRFLLKYNEALIAKRIKIIIEKYKIKEFIFINSFNIYYPNIGKLIPSTLNVYHCVDPIIIDFDTKHGFKSEQIILNKSDLVICTSKQLYKEKKEHHPHTYFIPNAADISHSQKARNKNTPIHKKLMDIKKPIIGYFGNIERRIDYHLLDQVFHSNLDKNFVLVGPYTKEFIPDNWYTASNIYLIGQVPFAKMPSILKGFDVAIIPFKQDQVSDTIFPLKLFEYLGSGKPIVSTSFNPDLKEFTHNTVKYCADAKEFSDAIIDALENDSLEKINNRVAIAEENTWEKRMGEFSDLLAHYLKVKSSS